MPAEPQHNHVERQIHMLAAWLAKTRRPSRDLNTFVGEHYRVNFTFEDDIPGLAGKLMLIFEHNPHLAYENVILGTSNAGKEHGYVAFVAFPGYLPYTPRPRTPKHVWEIDELYNHVRNASTLRVTPHHTTEPKETAHA